MGGCISTIVFYSEEKLFQMTTTASSGFLGKPTPLKTTDSSGFLGKPTHTVLEMEGCLEWYGGSHFLIQSRDIHSYKIRVLYLNNSFF